MEGEGGGGGSVREEGERKDGCPAGAESCCCFYFVLFSLAFSGLNFVFSIVYSSALWLRFFSQLFTHSCFNEQPMAYASVLSLMWFWKQLENELKDTNASHSMWVST